MFYFNLVFLLSFFLEILKSCNHVLLQSCFQSFFPDWNISFNLAFNLEIRYKKREKKRPLKTLSRFVHQLPILQHYKSPLLCSGVTNRWGRRCKTGLVNGRAYRFTLTPIRP